MAGAHNYTWYMGLTYDQWKKNGNNILLEIESDRKSGQLTNDQVAAIFKKRDSLYVAELAKANGGTVVESGGGHSYSPSANLPWWLNVPITAARPIVALGESIENGVENMKASLQGTKNAGLIVGGGLLLLLILLIRR